jgi:PIN domain nuclease of toxin-antitoxin system
MALLDTHVLLWWVNNDKRLSARARTEIARAERVFVSPVSFWEIATLVRRARLELDREPHVWAADVLAQDRVEDSPLRPVVAVAAGMLPDEFPGDPADRLLYATARDLVVPFVTKDVRLRGFARERRDLKTVW